MRGEVEAACGLSDWKKGEEERLAWDRWLARAQTRFTVFN